MNYLEEMFDFVEGSLEGDKELQLFHALSADSELRNRMKHLYSVKNAAKESASRFQPTAQETMAVFSALSVAPPKELVHTEPSVVNRLGKYVNRYSQGIAGAIIATLLIIGYMAFTSGNDVETNGNGYPVMSSVEGANSSVNNTVSNMNGTVADRGTALQQVDGSSTAAIADKQQDGSTRRNNGYVNSGSNNGSRKVASKDITARDNNDMLSAAESNSDQANASEDNTYNEVYAQEINRDAVGSLLNSRTARALPENSANSFSPATRSAASSSLEGVVLEFRGLSNFSYNEQYSPDGKKTSLNNLSIAAMYDIGNGFFVGCDVRQEHFYLMADKRALTSNNTSVDLALRLQPDFLSKYNLYPQFQVSAGASVNGYNARLLTGMKYNLTKNLSIIGGYELTGFRHNNSIYPFNTKSSVTYGISYGF